MYKPMFLEKLKLQLFAEESGENQGVAEPGTEGTQEPQGTEGEGDNQSTSGEGAVVAGQSTDNNTEPQQTEPIKQPQRDFEKDAAFARMRREAEHVKKQNEMLAQTLKQYGFKGETPEDVIDSANAYYLQKPIEEVRQQRLDIEKRQQEETQRQAELDFYRNKEIERLMEDDLKKIQKLDPSVKSLDELGEDYFNLIQAGVDGEVAFEAVKAKKQRETIIPPAEVGKVNSNSKAEKDYYTPEEVDRLSEKELENPKIWEVVRKSMTKWK